ncbi:hypothetical protein [Pseudomonas sp. NPDC079086]|uniref:hypothetical protein n=1 Tax=unclassified Pseudomonas TaxID=196821 RepID=UPI0037C916B4
MPEFEKTFYVQESWGRMATLTHLYAEMAEDAYDRYLGEMDNRIPEPSVDENPTDRMEQDDRLAKLGVQAIVFTAMALEAGVFDFAAINLGDGLARGHLDKLTLEGKWRVVPELVCGQSLRENGPALNNLNSLIQARNRLVHHKSKPMPYGDVLALESAVDDAKKSSKQFEQDVLLSFKTLVLLSLELHDLLGGSTPLPTFSKKSQDLNPHIIRSRHISQVIEKCRVTHRKTSQPPVI